MTKGITVAARKAKGRALQQKVRDAILASFATLEQDDVKSTAMGQGGEDVQLSPAARKLFPYSVEAKRHKTFAVYGPFEQATVNSFGYQPLLVIQGDRKRPLAIIDFEHFMQLAKRKADV